MPMKMMLQCYGALDDVLLLNICPAMLKPQARILGSSTLGSLPLRPRCRTPTSPH
jgi:hypothetical protein